MLKKFMKSLAGEFLNVLIDRGIIDFIAGQVVRDVLKAMEVKVFEVTKTEIARLELRPGDKIVLRHPSVISEYAIENLTKSMQGVFPEHKIIVLEEGLDMHVVNDGKDVDLVAAIERYRLAHSAYEASHEGAAELNDAYVSLLLACDITKAMAVKP